MSDVGREEEERHRDGLERAVLGVLVEHAPAAEPPDDDDGGEPLDRRAEAPADEGDRSGGDPGPEPDHALGGHPGQAEPAQQPCPAGEALDARARRPRRAVLRGHGRAWRPSIAPVPTRIAGSLDLMAWNVVIAGGGFGGFYAARTLERVLPAQSARVTLVSEDNFMLYTPLLPGAAAGTLEPRHVVVPLREELRRTDLQLGRVIGADPERNVLRIRALDGRRRGAALRPARRRARLGLAAAADPGLAEHGDRVPTLSEAIALRNGVLRTLEIAETVDDPAERRAWLTYVFVGAGYAGLEGLAELQDFAADVIELYPRCRDRGDALDPRRGARSRDARDLAVARGLRDRRAAAPRHRDPHEHDARGGHGRPRAQLSGGETVPTRTVVWTAGVRPTPVVAELGLTLAEGGRLAVDRHAALPRPRERVGDRRRRGGATTRRARGQHRPPTAQHAIRQGRLVARNVAASLGSGEVRRVPLQDARRLRRHGQERRGREHDGHPLARAARLVPGAHLPPAR